jgi:hypothetical protein
MEWDVFSFQSIQMKGSTSKGVYIFYIYTNKVDVQPFDRMKILEGEIAALKYDLFYILGELGDYIAKIEA